MSRKKRWPGALTSCGRPTSFSLLPGVALRPVGRFLSWPRMLLLCLLRTYGGAVPQGRGGSSRRCRHPPSPTPWWMSRTPPFQIRVTVVMLPVRRWKQWWLAPDSRASEGVTCSPTAVSSTARRMTCVHWQGVGGASSLRCQLRGLVAALSRCCANVTLLPDWLKMSRLMTRWAWLRLFLLRVTPGLSCTLRTSLFSPSRI